MRRKPGRLVPLEVAICLRAADLRRAGVSEFHGYEIAKRLGDASNRRFLTAYGTLYRALHRMLKDGWVVESARRPAADLDDERRRYYRLTPLGRRVASAEAERLWRLVTRARAHRLLSRA